MSPSPAQTLLQYFADPMCSWCWGFAPVIEQIKARYQDHCRVALIMGGLRPGNERPLDKAGREELLHHWHQVAQTTGQSFAFEGALPVGFIYDTEPACRAVVTMGERNPPQVFAYFKSIQEAFYLQQQDVTAEQTLLALAEPFDTQPHVFLERFHSEALIEKTRAHFNKTRRYGVRGFPTLVLQQEQRYYLICSGYRSFEQIRLELDALLR